MKGKWNYLNVEKCFYWWKIGSQNNYSIISASFSVIFSMILNSLKYSQQTQGVGPMLDWCWSSVVDDGPTSAQHRVNASCLRGNGPNCRVHIQANTTHVYNIYTTWDWRLSRWANIIQIFYKCLAFTGIYIHFQFQVILKLELELEKKKKNCGIPANIKTTLGQRLVFAGMCSVKRIIQFWNCLFFIKMGIFFVIWSSLELRQQSQFQLNERYRPTFRQDRGK